MGQIDVPDVIAAADVVDLAGNAALDQQIDAAAVIVVRIVLAALAALALGAACASAQTQTSQTQAWPQRTVRLIVPLSLIFIPVSEVSHLPWALGWNLHDSVDFVVSVITLHRTYYLVDVLVLYVLLLLTSAVVFVLLEGGRGLAWLVLGGSWLVWLLYQIVPDQVALVVTSTPSSNSGAALAGTVTASVFQALVFSEAIGCQLPVQVTAHSSSWNQPGYITGVWCMYLLSVI